jgi:hypothetical protein
MPLYSLFLPSYALVSYSLLSYALGQLFPAQLWTQNICWEILNGTGEEQDAEIKMNE